MGNVDKIRCAGFDFMDFLEVYRDAYWTVDPEHDKICPLNYWGLVQW
jgi:hypothetical protein